MQAVWFGPIKDEDAKKEIEQSVRSFLSTKAGKRFLELLDQQLKGCESQEIKMDAYDSPAWSHRQAHLNGFRQASLQMKQLFTLDHRS